MNHELATKLIDPLTRDFTWWDRDDRFDLYQTGLGWPLLVTVMDGFGSPASWPQDFGRSRSQTLFRALKDVSKVWTAFYIKFQDEAYAEMSWTRQIEGDQLAPTLLEEFSSNPADQGGSSFLGLFADNLDDMLLFTYVPGEFFRVSLFGAMKTAVPTALQR
jgi:hypothetical protein